MDPSESARFPALPEIEREVLLMRLVQQRTTAEIAAELKRSRGEIRAIQRRALRHLQELRKEPRPGVSRLDPRTSDS